MASKILAALLIAPLFLVGLVLTADYAVVDVRQGGADGTRIIVPMPLLLARVAMAFAPPQARYVKVPEIAPYQDDIRRAVGELRAADDGVLVEVENGDERVLIEKRGDDLIVDVVDGDAEQVHVTVPLRVVAEALDTYDGQGFDTRELVRLVGGIHGDVVRVRDGDEEVRVWVW